MQSESRTALAVSVGRGIALRTVLLLLCCVSLPGLAQSTAPGSSSQTDTRDLRQTPPEVHLVRSFASAADVRHPLHPILDRTLDIVAGPADPVPRIEALQFPAAVATDSAHRVLVADPGANAVHIFDVDHSKYTRLDADGDRLGAPVALAVDSGDNLYVTDGGTSTVLVYSSTGKFQRQLGKLRGGESYFESPTGIAIDRNTGHIYVCDTRRQMVIVMDNRGHLVMRIGKRGGGDQPGDFRVPTQAVVAGGELFVLDVGNTRIQVFDLAGHFRRAMPIASTDRKTGLAVDRERNVYVSDPALKIIRVFSHEGRPLYAFPPSTAPELEHSRPSGLWVSSDNCLYVVDSGIRRVGVFQISGTQCH